MKVKPFQIIRLFCIALAAGLIFSFFFSNRPPKETKLLQNFHTHRAIFEQLRDMIIADGQLVRLADWGVETTNSVIFHLPPEGDFPVKRYSEYMALLKQVGGLGAFRSGGEHSDPSIMLWARGFAGNTRHTGVCWLEHAPINQVSNLDNHEDKSQYPDRPFFYRHIDSKWYLWSDL